MTETKLAVYVSMSIMLMGVKKRNTIIYRMADCIQQNNSSIQVINNFKNTVRYE